MAGQAVSAEAAAEAFRRAYGDAADQVVLLRARVGELERENEALRKELTAAPSAPVVPGEVVRSGAAPAE